MYVLLFYHDKLHFCATYSICLRCASLKHKCRIMFWVLRCDYFIIFFSLSLYSWWLIYQLTFWVWVACLLKYFPCFGKCLSCHLQAERYIFNITVLTCQKGFSAHGRHQNEASVSSNSQDTAQDRSHSQCPQIPSLHHQKSHWNNQKTLIWKWHWN
jgi:hypothetical protein